MYKWVLRQEFTLDSQSLKNKKKQKKKQLKAFYDLIQTKQITVLTIICHIYVSCAQN